MLILWTIISMMDTEVTYSISIIMRALKKYPSNAFLDVGSSR